MFNKFLAYFVIGRTNCPSCAKQKDKVFGPYRIALEARFRYEYLLQVQEFGLKGTVGIFWANCEDNQDGTIRLGDRHFMSYVNAEAHIDDLGHPDSFPVHLLTHSFGAQK